MLPNGIGNDLIIFGLPLIGIVSSLVLSLPGELSRVEITIIMLACLLISTVSIPIHHAVPDRLINPYCGPTGVLIVSPRDRT